MRLMASKGWAPADLRVAASLKDIGAPAKACAVKTKKRGGEVTIGPTRNETGDAYDVGADCLETSGRPEPPLDL